MEEKLEFKDFQCSFKEFDPWSVNHQHEAYEIHMVMSGSQDVKVANRMYTLKRGHVFMLGPGFPHVYISNEKYSRYQITFTKKFLHKFFTDEFIKMIMKCYTSEVVHLTDNEIETFCDLFDKMQKEKENNGMYPLYFAHILHMLDKVSERHLENPIMPVMNSKEMAAVTNVVTYINSHYRTIRSIDEIAQACFISKSYLCHIFKQEYGMTVMEYLKRVRIRYACEFLATTDKTFSLIATKMGFADISHFTKNFKRIKGCTPREYRERKKREREENNE